jgi:hypothetical protein
LNLNKLIGQFRGLIVNKKKFKGIGLSEKIQNQELRCKRRIHLGT